MNSAAFLDMAAFLSGPLNFPAMILTLLIRVCVRPSVPVDASVAVVLDFFFDCCGSWYPKPPIFDGHIHLLFRLGWLRTGLADRTIFQALDRTVGSLTK